MSLKVVAHYFGEDTTRLAPLVASGHESCIRIRIGIQKSRSNVALHATPPAAFARRGWRG